MVAAQVGPDHDADRVRDEQRAVSRGRAASKRAPAAGFPYERLVYPQLAAGERSVSTQQALDLVALAEVARREPAAPRVFSRRTTARSPTFGSALAGTRFLDRFDRFLEQLRPSRPLRVGLGAAAAARAAGAALFAIRGHLQGPPPDLKRGAGVRHADAAAAWRAFEARLTWLAAMDAAAARALPTLRAPEAAVRVARAGALGSDARAVAHSAWHLALADRFVERGWLDRRDDYFLLQLDEIGARSADPSQGPSLRTIAARRAAQLAAERDLRMPLLMRESELPTLLLGALPAHGRRSGATATI